MTYIVIDSHRYVIIFGISVLLPVRRAGHETETEGSHERPTPGVCLTVAVVSPGGQSGLAVRTEMTNIERPGPAH